MTLQPILERELRMTARRPGVYWNRFSIPIVLLVIVWAEMDFMPFLSTAAMGRALFSTLSYLALFVCLLEGVRQTADCISQEKRDGTLGLLFLTDLKGFDVIVGKLAAASLASFQGLLAMVPILGCALFLGGVTLGEVLRVSLALISLLGFSLAVGLWVSSRSISASRAMGGTILILIAVLLPTVLFYPYSTFFDPAWSFGGALETNYVIHPLAYWGSLVLTQVYVVGLLKLAAENTHRFREGDVPTAQKNGSLPRENSTAASMWAKRAKVMRVNPVSWLASRKSGSISVWALCLTAVAAVVVFMLRGRLAPSSRMRDFLISFSVVLLIHYILKVFLAAQACRCLSEARTNSTLEIMLCTPLKVEDILRGQVLALQRLFLKPFLIVLALEMFGIYWQLDSNFGTPATGGLVYRMFGPVLIGCEGALVMFFFLDLQAIVWTGIWFGLCSKNESTATFKTTVYVVALPILFLALTFIGALMFVIWPIAAYVWARLQLQEHLRFLAGLRSLSSGSLTAWMPFHVPGLPPASDEGYDSITSFE